MSLQLTDREILLIVDPSSPSGLRWGMSRAGMHPGDIAGTLYNGGYYKLNTGGKTYPTHNIV
jgi:hypothetical protein